MMNVIEIQEALKGMPIEQLVKEMQTPSGQAPQFLVLGEIARRKQMEQDFAQRQGQEQTTVAEDVVTAAGVPQGGLAGLAQSLAPQSALPRNTGASAGSMQPMSEEPQRMAGGGIVALQAGGPVMRQQAGGRPGIESRVMEIARQFGVSFGDALQMLENNPALLAGPSMLRDEATTPQGGLSSLMPPGGGIADMQRQQASVAGGIADTERQQRGMNEALSGRVGMDTSSAAAMRNRLDEYTYPEVPPAIPEGMEMELARAALGEEALSGRLGMDTSEEATLRNRAAMLADAVPSIPGPRSPAAIPFGDLAGLIDVREPTLDRRAQFEPFEPDVDSVYDRAMTGEELLAAAAGPAAPLPVPPGLTSMPFGDLAGLAGVAPNKLPPAASVGGGAPNRGEAYRLAREAERQEAETDMMTTGTPLAIGEGGIDALMPPAMSKPEPPGGVRRPPPGGGGVAAGASPYEQELMDILNRREKRAEQDKWLALAQAGMALLSSKQPSFAGALGEAGIVGVEGFKKARDQYEEDRLSLMAEQERLRGARAAASARTAKNSRGLKPGDISNYFGKRAEIIKNMSDPVLDEETRELYRRELIALERAFLSSTSAPFDATVGAEE